MNRAKIERTLRDFRPTPKLRCRVIGQGDEDYCATCGLRWPQVEERPSCPKGLDQ